MSEQASTNEKCPACGTTIISFDPPLVFDESESCGVVKPGNYANPPGGIPHCELTAGHPGEHMYLVEYVDQWV